MKFLEWLKEVREDLAGIADDARRLLAGQRRCFYCSKWAERPHDFFRHAFCDRLCAARWRQGIEIMNAEDRVSRRQVGCE